jgi:hypothetical protein
MCRHAATDVVGFAAAHCARGRAGRFDPRRGAALCRQPVGGDQADAARALDRRRRARLAPAALLFANGCGLGSRLPHIPEVKIRPGRSEGVLGLAPLAISGAAARGFVRIARSLGSFVRTG